MKQGAIARLKRAVIVGGAAAGAATLALSSAVPAGAASTNPSNSIIVGSGSSTTYLMMQELDQLFNNATSCTLTSANTAVAPQPLDFACVTGGGGDPLALEASATGTPINPFADVVLEEPAIGSGSGIGQLLKDAPGAASPHTTTVNVANNVDFARSSRVKGASDYAGLNFVAYAEDAVSWFHYLSVPVQDHVITKTNGVQVSDVETPSHSVATPSAGISSLTKAQVVGIWSGTYTNWNQVGGSDSPIAVFSAQTGSGTQSTFKTYLGVDPSDSSRSVNCVTVDSVKTCGGPAIIFENQLASLNKDSFLGDNQIAFKNDLVNNHPVGGNKHITTIDNRTATVANLTGTAFVNTSKKVYVSSLTGLAAGAVVTIAGATGTYTVNTVLAAQPRTNKPAAITLTAKLTGSPTYGGTISWTNTTDVSTSWSNSDQNAAVRAAAIYFYSYGAWKHQTDAPNGTSTRNCATNGCGGIKLAAQYTAALGNIDSVNLNDNHTLDGTFPAVRYLYNVYSNGSNARIKAAASPATLNYVSEAGFICKPQNASITNPTTGNSYLSDVQSAITSSGFFPLSAGYTSGVVNTSPIADEGSVAHPVGGMTLTSGSKTYGSYMNVSGTGLTGGYQSSNGDPSGFCLVSTTDGNAA